MAWTDAAHREIKTVRMEVPLSFPLAIFRGEDDTNVVVGFYFYNAAGWVCACIHCMEVIAVLFVNGIWKSAIFALMRAARFLVKTQPINAVFVEHRREAAARFFEVERRVINDHNIGRVAARRRVNAFG